MTDDIRKNIARSVPANFHYRVMKRWLTTVRPSLPSFSLILVANLNFKCRKSTAQHNQILKYAICFQLDNEILSQQQKNLILQ